MVTPALDVSPSAWLARRHALALEAGGLLSVGVLALLAVAHTTISPRADFLYFDGDTQLPGLVAISLATGDPTAWTMSTTLFIPEIALFLLWWAITPSPAWAFAVSAFANLVILAVLLRWSAGIALADRSRGVRVAAGVGVFAVYVGFTLFENTPVRGDFQLFSMSMTSTFYFATLVATIVTMNLVVATLTRPAASGRRIITVSAGIVAIAAVSVVSCPLYAAWAAAPAIIVILASLIAKITPRAVAAALLGAVVIGTIGGLAARPLAAPWLSSTGAEYVRWFQVGPAARSLATIAVETVMAPGGWIVVLGIIALVALTGIALVRAVRGGDRGPTALLPLWALVTAIGVPAGILLMGQVDVARYTQPVALLPLAALPASLRQLGVRFDWQPPRRPARIVITAMGVAAALILVPVTAASVSDVKHPDVDCVEAAIGSGVDRAAIGGFWTIRSLAVASEGRLRLLQTFPNGVVFPWMIDLDPFRDPGTVGTAIIASAQEAEQTTADFGTPRAVIGCGSIEVWDYRGTAAADAITANVVGSGLAALQVRGR